MDNAPYFLTTATVWNRIKATHGDEARQDGRPVQTAFKANGFYAGGIPA